MVETVFLNSGLYQQFDKFNGQYSQVIHKITNLYGQYSQVTHKITNLYGSNIIFDDFVHKNLVWSKIVSILATTTSSDHSF